MASCTPEPHARREIDASTAGAVVSSPARESLSRETRALLHARMQRHGAEMSALLSAVVVLDWPMVRRVCTELIEEPALAPPLPGEDDSFNARFPPSFFVQQQSLLVALRELRRAAEQQSDHASKRAFNGVTAACVDCHAAYLPERARPTLSAEPPRLP